MLLHGSKYAFLTVLHRHPPLPSESFVFTVGDRPCCVFRAFVCVTVTWGYMLFDLVMVVVNQKIVQDNPVIVVHHLYILLGGLLHWLYAPVAWGYCWQANSFSTHQHTHTEREQRAEREVELYGHKPWQREESREQRAERCMGYGHTISLGMPSDRGQREQRDVWVGHKP